MDIVYIIRAIKLIIFNCDNIYSPPNPSKQYAILRKIRGSRDQTIPGYLAPQEQIPWVRGCGFSRVHSTQSFARVMYCRDRDLVSVCRDVCRNPGGIIKLQERLLNEGSGQNMKIIQAFKIYGCKRSKIFGNIQVSMALFFSSYIHQGNDLFSVQSRGKQCAFMSLSALLTAQNIPLIDCQKQDL